ncbi:2-oxoglutarate dehydrogenase E1 component [Enterobacteriaceae endosymbiont of Donacia tomentosa]|uniref:2-oxoglutarate dehydrogenase E1 component n=1 Tax=Enterobacteriaceae endosymbiont of Donacia tomentosa TaxID=2675787 RepID=UPI0014496255|nr:2-oxoglutarate dehydrogenase E1 component [Enterobacteriaceae endosymbiont of Donacia tomentosa]QJC31641.1 2-oxoglutarate dehydrogenase E1 component [Enterobacteriaceae endosymbiont of Donacia tomentosa]
MNNYFLQKNFLDYNIFYIENLYQNFLMNSNSIDKSWIDIFKKQNQKINKKRKLKYTKYDVSCEKIYLKKKINKLINDFRISGHYNANINPLFYNKKKYKNLLSLRDYGISEKDFEKKNILNNTLKEKKIIDIYNFFKNIYSNYIGIEYMYLPYVEKNWLKYKIESNKNNFNNIEKKIFLEELIASEVFEKCIGKMFPGAKRFSLEGCDVLIPLIKEIIRYINIKENKNIEIIFGMAHRGRLNFLANIMGKKIQKIINEFSNNITEKNNIDDVKYHLGYYSSFINSNNKKIKLQLTFNPSHLEIINSVVMGIAKYKNDILKNKKSNFILPICIHGDVAFSGQGIIQEILNLSKTRGYGIHGIIHIIINNQIGFTTDNIKDIRSSYYCTDIAKMIQCPVFHINANKIEDVISIIKIAIDFRNTFNKDVFIDLVSYRRHGHNEMDDPYITQPLMYKLIKKQPTIQELYFNKLLSENIVNDQNKLILYEKYQNLFNQGKSFIETNKIIENNCKKIIQKKLTIKNLKNLLFKISTIPEEFNPHFRVKKIYLDRIEMSKGNMNLDWGTAENLAYANILTQGISCRLSGEDVKRGTFSHRHSVIYDQINNSSYTSLQNLGNNQGNFYIYNSVLSEESVLGFEYGYSINNLNILTIWEAQFGDFANGAQVIIDQFISSGEKKWGYKSGLVMMLPHGYEGQGPEHSSARIERYLQLCAENNMFICIPSNSVQIYYLLCQQAFNYNKKPLIIITPKSLLRYKLSFSSLNNFINNSFQTIIDEINLNINIKNIKRIIFCSGKIYYDLFEYRNFIKNKSVVLIRIEQLYPFPEKELLNIINKYIKINNFFWCQEEPINQGSWIYIHNYFINKLGYNIRYIGRNESASTATGFFSVHKKQQQKIINSVFNTK